MAAPSFIKKSIYSWMIFFSTLGILSAGYAGFNALNISDADPGKPLTSSMMQAVIGNLADLDSRVSSMSGAVTSLQGFWGTVTGGIGYSGGNVGIGTMTPTDALTLSSNAVYSILSNKNYTSAWSTGGGFFMGYRARGTESAPQYVQANDIMAGFMWRDGTLDASWGGTIVYASENHSATSQWNYLSFYTTNNGAIGGSEKMRIDQNGNVGIGTISPDAHLAVNGSFKSGNTWARVTPANTTFAGTEVTLASLSFNCHGGPVLIFGNLNNHNASGWSNSNYRIKSDGVTIRSMVLTSAMYTSYGSLSVPLQTLYNCPAGIHTFSITGQTSNNVITNTDNIEFAAVEMGLR